MKWRTSRNIKDDSTGVTYLCALPDELLLKIFSSLSPSSLLSCLLSCRRLHLIAADPILCKCYCMYVGQINKEFRVTS